MSEGPIFVTINNVTNNSSRTVNTVTNNVIFVVEKHEEAPIIYRPPRFGFVRTALGMIKAVTKRKPPPDDKDELLRSV